MTDKVQGKHHRLLRDLLLSNYINVFAFSLFGPLYALYIHSMGATIIEVSRLLALYSFVLGLCLFIFGRWQNTISDKRRSVVIGFFLLSAGAFSYLLVHSVATAYLVQIVNAIACAWFMPAWKCIYGRGLEAGRETEGWGMVDGGSQILAAIGMAAGGVVVATIGFTQLILMVGVLQLVGGFYSLAIFKHEAP